MATGVYLKSCEINNYRGLRKLTHNGFKRINLVGGLNGSGKTSLLEALFLLNDRRNPSPISRPFHWRNLELNVEESFRFTASNEQLSVPVTISAQTKNGRQTVRLQWEEQQDPEQSDPLKINMAKAALDFSTTQRMGLTLYATVDGEPTQETHILDAGPQQLKLRHARPSTGVVALCTMLSKATMHSQAELAERFTLALQKKLRRRLVSIASAITPNIKDLELLQLGSASILCGVLHDETYLPLNMLGDGTLTAISIALAIIQCAKGIVFLDEFDTAIHFSKLATVWNIIAELAKEFETQIFAATHSLECIRAAEATFSASNLNNDFVYLRLDRLETEVIVTAYSSSELSSALKEEWEVR